MCLYSPFCNSLSSCIISRNLKFKLHISILSMFGVNEVTYNNTVIRTTVPNFVFFSSFYFIYVPSLT
jgi:hypothetical protein